MKLEIGCGNIGLGDINTDIKRPRTKLYNFVLCDALTLPFKDCAFSHVESHHVIEHVKNPFKFLKEIRRVLQVGGYLLLTCPHRFSSGAKDKGHIHFFTRKWFVHYLKGCRAYARFHPPLVHNIEVHWRKTSI